MNFITSSDKNSTDLSTSQYSPNHSNGQDSGFADYDMSDSEMDCQNDIEDMCCIATLAKHFGLTSFRTYQKEVIHEYLNGRDTIVVQPTGSGKSLCYQFPAVYTGKMSIVISPMISLMVDQVAKLKRQGVSSTYLGSAHHDKTLEHNILHGNTDITVLFVTPEWLFSSNRIELVRQLVQEKKIALIAVDEAHLIFEWQTFREQYKKVETLKQEYLKWAIHAVDSYSYTRNNGEATGNVCKSINFKVYS